MPRCALVLILLLAAVLPARAQQATDRDIVIYDVQDQTASVKVTAWWGTDYMLLGKENGRWMITHVLWQSPPRTAVR